MCVCGGGGVLYTYCVKHVYVVFSLKHVFVVLSAELCMCVCGWVGGGVHVHTRCETCVRPWCEDYVRGYCSKMMCNVPCASTCVKTN